MCVSLRCVLTQGLVEHKLVHIDVEAPVADPLDERDRRLVQIKTDVAQAVKRYPLLAKPDHRVDQEPRSGASTPLPHLHAIPLRLQAISASSTPQITISDPSSQLSIPESSHVGTHSDAICRMLYASPIAYDPGQADIISVLYLVYLKGSDTHDAEADAFWAFQKLVPDVQSAHTDPSLLAQRLKWADEHLYNILLANDLDPSSPLYAFRWQHSILTADIPLPDVLYLLDALIVSQNRSATLVDICTAILIVSKKHLFRRQVQGLWGQEGQDDVDFVKGLTFLRNIPLERIGGTEGILGAVEALAAIVPPPAPITMSPSSSITDRLSRLVQTVSPPPPTPTASLPRPLLLQNKARRASTPLSTPIRRDSTSSNRSSVLWSPPMRGRDSSDTLVGRQLTYGQLAVALVGLGRRPPRRLVPALATIARRFKSSYPDHVPLNSAQSALLAVGSGVVGIADTRRGGELLHRLC